jgi:hypothetical protein
MSRVFQRRQRRKSEGHSTPYGQIIQRSIGMFGAFFFLLLLLLACCCLLSFEAILYSIQPQRRKAEGHSTLYGQIIQRSIGMFGAFFFLLLLMLACCCLLSFEAILYFMFNASSHTLPLRCSYLLSAPPVASLTGDYVLRRPPPIWTRRSPPLYFV